MMNTISLLGYTYSDGSQVLKMTNDDKEPQEEYRYPPRLRILENKLNSYYRQHDDYINDRAKSLKEIKKLSNRLILEKINLDNIDKHIRELELKIKLVSKEWNKEMEHI